MRDFPADHSLDDPSDVVPDRHADEPVRVLLVEDDEDDYVLTQGLLNSTFDQGCTLSWERTFDGGLRRILHEPFDVALVDYRLGIRDGVQLIREARAAGSRISIILLTGQNDRAIDLAATRAGASDFLSKTEVSSAALERAIRYSMQNAKMQEQRVRLLAERSARVEAEADSRAKDRFLAMLSHELRTPLTPVLMAISTVAGEPTLSPSVRQDLDMIRRNVELEARLIDDLLDITRISRGALQLRTAPMDMHRKVHEALRLCQTEIESRKHKINKRLEADQTGLIGDPGRVQQIVWILINNAVKFTPPGGAIDIHTFNEANELVLQIRDTGVGIDAALLPRLFDAFERGVRPNQDNVNGGLGLGLAISKAIAALHRGSLSAVSEGPGKGATFTLRLPITEIPSASLTPAPITPAPAPSPPVSRNGQPKILFVEDHVDTAAALIRVLKRNSFDVIQARTVAEAITAMEERSFDLLISDIGLPDGSGLEIIRAARDKGKNFPAIAVSGYGMSEDVQSSKAAGFDKHLTKPVHPDVLVSTVQSLVTP